MNIFDIIFKLAIIFAVSCLTYINISFNVLKLNSMMILLQNDFQNGDQIVEYLGEMTILLTFFVQKL